jgi:hypothetical protein
MNNSVNLKYKKDIINESYKCPDNNILIRKYYNKGQIYYLIINKILLKILYLYFIYLYQKMK